MQVRHDRLVSLLGVVLVLMVVWQGCKPLSATEVTAARKSPDALAAALLEAYRGHDLRAFEQLAIPPGEVKAMMEGMNLPEHARRQSMEGKAAFMAQAKDSLGHILDRVGVDWSTVANGRFVAERKPVEVSPGYKLCLGRLELEAGGKHLRQPLTIVECQTGYMIADFGPFEETH